MLALPALKILGSTAWYYPTAHDLPGDPMRDGFYYILVDTWIKKIQDQTNI